jgi:hypothetical protein
LGEAFDNFITEDLRDMGQRELEKALINMLLPVE